MYSVARVDLVPVLMKLPSCGAVIGILISSQLFYNLSDEECAKIRQRLDQKEALRNKAEH